MSFKNLPTILALLAGFLVCIVTFLYQYQGVTWLWLVLGAILLFYGLGQCLKKLFSVILVEPKEEEEESDENSSQEGETENAGQDSQANE